jgi:hypothetical protein
MEKDKALQSDETKHKILHNNGISFHSTSVLNTSQSGSSQSIYDFWWHSAIQSYMPPVEDSTGIN